MPPICLAAPSARLATMAPAALAGNRPTNATANSLHGSTTPGLNSTREAFFVLVWSSF